MQVSTLCVYGWVGVCTYVCVVRVCVQYVLVGGGGGVCVQVCYKQCIAPYSDGLQQLLPGILHCVGEDLLLHPVVVDLLPRNIHNVPHNLTHNLMAHLLS